VEGGGYRFFPAESTILHRAERGVPFAASTIEQWRFTVEPALREDGNSAGAATRAAAPSTGARRRDLQSERRTATRLLAGPEIG
jgi:hypothetical protein